MANWRDNIRKITPYVAGEQLNDRKIIKLNANENPYPPSPAVAEVFKNFKYEDLRKYPPIDSTKLKEALAKYHNVSKEQIFVGNGSDDVIATCFMAFFNSEKPLLFPDVTYSFYPVWSDLFSIEYKTVPLNENFRINPDDYAIEKGGVILPNPNAPTGIGEGREFIEKLADNCKDCVIVIDEAYVDFSNYSAIELLDKYENLVITRTFSKSRSLAGLRLGYAVASKELIAALETVKNSYNSYAVDALAIEAGTASVEDDEYFKNSVEKIKRTRQRLTDELTALGVKVYKSDANFILATGKSNFNAKDIFAHLKSVGILVRYFNLPRIDDCLRITVGTDEETDALISAIKNYAKENGINAFN